MSMNAESIGKIVQLYLLQNLYNTENGNSSGSGYSAIFEMVLQNAVKDLPTKEEPIISEISKYFEENFKSYENGVDYTDKEISNSLDKAISLVSKKYNVEEDFIRAMIKQESSFNPNAVSKSGAMGLMQLMPKTAESLGVKNPFDMLENLDGGVRYIKSLMEAFRGNKELALAAYNGGISRMNKRGVDTPEEIVKMPEETRKYVKTVIQNYEKYKRL